MQTPSLGRIVTYHTNHESTAQLNRLEGKKYQLGEKVPGIIVNTGPDGKCNLMLFPDAQEPLHVQNVPFGTGNGQWSWPEKVGESQEAAA